MVKLFIILSGNLLSITSCLRLDGSINITVCDAQSPVCSQVIVNPFEQYSLQPCSVCHGLMDCFDFGFQMEEQILSWMMSARPSGCWA